MKSLGELIALCLGVLANWSCQSHAPSCPNWAGKLSFWMQVREQGMFRKRAPYFGTNITPEKINNRSI